MIENCLIEISESDVREALIEYINKHSCLRLKPLENFKIGSTDIRNAFQYTLETFSEKRETKWKYYGYKGGEIDGEENGAIPYKWDVKVNTPESFSRKIKIKLVMPHSEEVKICHCCHGSGKQQCFSCNGLDGRNVTTNNSNTNSHYSRYQSCGSCGGSGRQTCSACRGEYNLFELFSYLNI
jgi:DnaJ-class molecular chaperone